jgi:Mg2+ and Co2+ transporter CorA
MPGRTVITKVGAEEDADLAELNVLGVVVIPRGAQYDQLHILVVGSILGRLWKFCERPELLAAGSESVLWAVLDQMADSYAPVVAGLGHDIDQIEATVRRGAVGRPCRAAAPHSPL